MENPAAPVAPRMSPLKFGAIVVGIIVLLCIFLSVTGLGLRLIAAVPGPRVDGQIGHIAATGPSTLAARDIATYDLIAKSGTERLAAFLADDRIFLVANGTRVKVLEVSAPRTHVQILDGAHTGEDGWVLTTFVQQ